MLLEPPASSRGVGSENTTAEAPADESADLICNLPKINVLLMNTANAGQELK